MGLKSHKFWKVGEIHEKFEFIEMMKTIECQFDPKIQIRDN